MALLGAPLFAVDIPCAAGSLAAVMGNRLLCDQVVFDFTGGAYAPFGTNALSAADIWVMPGAHSIAFSVIAAGGGVSGTGFADTSNNNAVEYDITYGVLAGPFTAMTGFSVVADHLVYGSAPPDQQPDGGQIIVTSTATYTGPLTQAQVDEGLLMPFGGGDIVFAQSSDSAALAPFATTLQMKTSILLNPFSSVSVQSVENDFDTTPEPATWILAAAALLLPGIRKNRRNSCTRF
jgi:hypothetical protein